jgi:hypothetical protein
VPRFKTSARRLLLRHKLFDPAFYLERYPDLAAARVHPFAHYLLHGAAEGRKPNPWFDPDYYLARSPQARRRVDLNGRDPFVDFLEHDATEHSSPHPLVDGACDGARRRGELSNTAGLATEGAQFTCDS